MPEPSKLILFITASLVLLVTPGPAVLYIVARSIDQGRLAGVVSALGIAVGTLVHVAAATLGLSALLISSPAAFAAIRYAGAAYLVYLGMRRLLEPARPITTASAAPAGRLKIFRQGVVVNLLNPKTALFFLAFLPQFVDPSRGPVARQSLLLGGLFVSMAVCSDSTYALLSGTFGRWLKGSRSFLSVERYVAGAIYILLGLLASGLLSFPLALRAG